jgi:hypothetical protein
VVSAQICGSGEGGFSRRDRPSTWLWSLWSPFGCRRAADAVAFPSADRGGEGVEGDGTTVFLVRVVCCLFLRCDCRGVKLLLAGHGGEGRMRLDVASVVRTYWSSPSPACLMFWKGILAVTPWGGHSCGVQRPMWR